MGPCANFPTAKCVFVKNFFSAGWCHAVSAWHIQVVRCDFGWFKFGKRKRKEKEDEWEEKEDFNLNRLKMHQTAPECRAGTTWIYPVVTEKSPCVWSSWFGKRILSLSLWCLASKSKSHRASKNVSSLFTSHSNHSKLSSLSLLSLQFTLSLRLLLHYQVTSSTTLTYDASFYSSFIQFLFLFILIIVQYL